MAPAHRVQLRRTKGWKKPPNTVVVSRPSKWGNPYRLTAYTVQGAGGSPLPPAEADSARRDLALRDFEAAIDLGGIVPFTRADVRRELRGKNLACWCPLSKKCHADVLLEVARSDG